MGDLGNMICVKMRSSSYSKGRAMLIRAKGMLIRALWPYLSGSMPKFFRREIKGFIAEISVRNQSTKPCYLRNSWYWALFTGVAAGETGTEWSSQNHHGQRPTSAKAKSQSSPMGPPSGRGNSFVVSRAALRSTRGHSRRLLKLVPKFFLMQMCDSGILLLL